MDPQVAESIVRLYVASLSCFGLMGSIGTKPQLIVDIECSVAARRIAVDLKKHEGTELYKLMFVELKKLESDSLSGKYATCILKHLEDEENKVVL